MPGPPDDQKNILLIFFGICVWDYLSSLWFEYKLICGKIRFRWQFIPYFLARYFVLVLGVVSAVDVFTSSIPGHGCHNAVLNAVGMHFGLLSIVFGTWNLLTRTAIIWGYHPLLVKILIATGLSHFALAFVAADVGRGSCSQGPLNVLNVMIFGPTTAVIEFAVLLLSLVGIKRANCTQEESRLARLLRTQGIAYFLMVLLVQLSTIVVSLTPTVALTRMWVGIASSILSAILSCRLVTSTISQGGHIPKPEPVRWSNVNVHRNRHHQRSERVLASES